MQARRGGQRGAGTASGLRPASAFVLIGLVLLAVCGKATHLALVAPGSQPDPSASVTAPWARFEVADRGGRPALAAACDGPAAFSPRW